MNYIETFKLDKNRNKIKIKMIDLENYSKIYSGNNYKLIHKNGGRGLILHQTWIFDACKEEQRKNDESVRMGHFYHKKDENGIKYKKFIEPSNHMKMALKITYSRDLGKIDLYAGKKGILIETAETFR